MDKIVLNANGKTNAYKIILCNGFVDIFPEADFYDNNKVYLKDGKYYEFDGWNMKKVNGNREFPSLNMKQVLLERKEGTYEFMEKL